MARSKYLDNLEDAIFEGLVDIFDTVNEVFPSDSIIQSTLMMSYMNMRPEEQVAIIEQLGADWFVKLSAKIEKRLRDLT